MKQFYEGCLTQQLGLVDQDSLAELSPHVCHPLAQKPVIFQNKRGCHTFIQAPWVQPNHT